MTVAGSDRPLTWHGGTAPAVLFVTCAGLAMLADRRLPPASAEG